MWWATLFACAWVTEPEWLARTDADGDGFVSAALGGDDCDDANGAIHPGADEDCDGFDQDCDGAADDGAPGAQYTDRDGDGHGVGPAPVGCQAGVGLAPVGDDCDDTTASVSPGATEACNGVDDDCDGAVDENGGQWWPDDDGDTFGDADATPVAGCEPPATVGWADNGDDCDDGADAVAPGRYDACNDGVDADCDGADDACGGTYDLLVEDAEVRYQMGTSTYGRSGSAVLSADFSGDGKDDLLFSAGGSTGTAFFCEPGPIPRGDHVADVRWGFLASTVDGGFSALASGDLNDDGRVDIVAGSVVLTDGGNVTGGVWITYGGFASTLGPGDYRIGTDLPGARIGGAVADAAFGQTLATGDLTGDGVDDVAIGRPGAPGSGHEGDVFVLPGGAAFASGSVTSVGVRITAPAGATLGYALAAGDFDADGDDELATGGPTADSAAGLVAVFDALSRTGTLTTADADRVLGGPSSYSWFGGGLAAGDLDGDGYEDLAVGAPDADGGQGRISLYRGAATFAGWKATAPDATFDNDSLQHPIGINLWITGDVTGDDAADLVAGLPFDGSDPVDSHVWIWSDRWSGGFDTEQSAVHAFSAAGYEEIGRVFSAGDLDGDGDADPVIGAPGKAGSVFVWLGEVP